MKNTTIGYLVGKETFSPGEGDNPNFFNFPRKFFSDRKEALDTFKREKRTTTIMIPQVVMKKLTFAWL